MGRSAALLLTTALAMPSVASAGGMFFGFGAAGGDVNFDADVSAGNNVLSDDDLVGEIGVGYLFDTQVVLEGGASQGLSIDVFLFGDAFALQDFRVMAGYAFEAGERFKFVPELGVSSWKIDTSDSSSSFLGSSRRELDDSGTDLMWRFSTEIRVATRMHLYVAYSAASYDFGDATRLGVGVKWQF